MKGSADKAAALDPVPRVLSFRRWRWGALAIYLVALPFLAVLLHPAVFLIGIPLVTITGLVLFIRRGRHRLAPELFEDGERFASVIDALPKTFGLHLYLRERYSRDEGKQGEFWVAKTRSVAGLRSKRPFLVWRAPGARLFLTPQRYWLQRGGTITGGPTASINLEPLDLQEKVVRPRDDDEVLGSTWLYATKRGDRDLRFKDNRELWLVRRHAVELSLGHDRWAICLYGVVNARMFGSALGEITGKPFEIEYDPELDPEEADPNRRTQQPTPRAWYEVLGVAPQATVGEIKAAYHRLLMQYHPDRVAGLGVKLQQVATDEAGEIIGAYKAGIAARGRG